MVQQLKKTNKKTKKRSNQRCSRLNCADCRRNKENISSSSSEIYERVHVIDSKKPKKKSKLARLIFNTPANLLEYFTPKTSQTHIIMDEKTKNAFSNELYTSPVVLLKSIFTETSYSSGDYAEAKTKAKRQLSFTDSYQDKKSSMYHMPYDAMDLEEKPLKHCKLHDSYINLPQLHYSHLNCTDLNNTMSSVFSPKGSLFNVSSNSYSINEKIFAVSKDIAGVVPGDLDLKFSDRVKLIHQNEEYSLVENIISGKRGYAPSRYLITLSVFLNNYAD